MQVQPESLRFVNAVLSKVEPWRPIVKNLSDKKSVCRVERKDAASSKIAAFEGSHADKQISKGFFKNTNIVYSSPVYRKEIERIVNSEVTGYELNLAKDDHYDQGFVRNYITYDVIRDGKLWSGLGVSDDMTFYAAISGRYFNGYSPFIGKSGELVSRYCRSMQDLKMSDGSAVFPFSCSRSFFLRAGTGASLADFEGPMLALYSTGLNFGTGPNSSNFRFKDLLKGEVSLAASNDGLPLYVSKLAAAAAVAYVEDHGGYVFAPGVAKDLYNVKLSELTNDKFFLISAMQKKNIGLALFPYFSSLEDAVIVSTLESIGIRCYAVLGPELSGAKFCRALGVKLPLSLANDNGYLNISGVNRVIGNVSFDNWRHLLSVSGAGLPVVVPTVKFLSEQDIASQHWLFPVDWEFAGTDFLADIAISLMIVLDLKTTFNLLFEGRKAKDFQEMRSVGKSLSFFDSLGGENSIGRFIGFFSEATNLDFTLADRSESTFLKEEENG